MKKLNRIAAFLLSAAMVFSLCACGKDEESRKPSTPYEKLNLAAVDSGTVAENSGFSLSWDAERACVSLTDKASGDVWSTIPEDYYKTGDTSGRAGIMLGSPIMLEYVSEKNRSAVKSVNGYTGIMKNGKIGSIKTDNGIKVYYCFDKLEIIIPVEYSLGDTGLSITVVPDEIIEYDNLVYKISLAPFLCSAANSDSKEQYIVVPSGSGAVMYTDIRSGGAREYSEPVYGSDPARFEGENPINTATVRMPVFGAKSGNSAILGIITSGAASAEIDAIAGDEKIGWSGVYPTFTLRGSNVSAVSFNGGNVTEVETISEELTGYEKLSVSYHTLSGENADYSGMAEVYREYIKQTSGSNEELDEAQLTVKLLGGLQLKKLMLGIPYQKTVSATTFSEALDIVKDIEDKTGVLPDVILSGFGESGLDIGKIAGGFGFSDAMGSKKDLKALQDYCKKQGINLYTDFDIVRFNDSSNGFSQTFDAAKSSNSFTAFQYHYSVSLRNEDESLKRYVMLSRAKLGEAAEKLFDFAKESGISGIGLSTLGNTAYSDYDDKKSFVRAGSESSTQKIIKAAQKQGLSVAVSDADSYAAALADKITDAPVGSSMYDILDVDIPLYQMVFKGVTDISASAVNTASDTRKSFLKAIEGGSGIAFTLSARYDSDFATTIHSAFATSLYSDNSALISELVSESSEFYKAVNGAEITEHTVISDTLRSTEFSNGVTLWVNYADEAVTVEGVTVDANSFTFRGENK